jgi:beta-galactosidase/beta-glucuronidase
MCGSRTCKVYILDKAYGSYARAIVEENLSATVVVSVELEGSGGGTKVQIVLNGPNGKEIKSTTLGPAGSTEARWSFQPGELELWWPHQLGKPALHSVCVTLSGDVSASGRRS